MDRITCEMFEARVGDELDGELAPDVRAAMDRHAASCTACTALLADLRRIQADARQLAPLVPSRDLWQGIEARIQAPVIPLAESERTTARRAGARTWQVAPHWLAAAAAALIVASSGLTYLLTRPDTSAGETGSWVIAGAYDPEGTVRPASASGGSEDASAMRASTDREIAELRDVIARRRSALDSATVATIERSLRVIDDAITESRAALSRDPGNSFLNEQLDETLQRKLELMRALAFTPVRS